MTYRQKTKDKRQKHCQPNVLNLENSTLFISETTLQSSHPSTSKNLSRSFRIGIRLSIKQRLRLKKRTTPVSHTNLPFAASSSKAILAFIPLLILPYSFNTQALSATTAKTIEGTKPYLLLSDGVTKLTNLNELLGFSMPKQDGSAGREQIDASMAGRALTAPAGMKYSDVIAAVTADGIVQAVGATVGDDDGDASVPANTSITGMMKATWYEGTAAVAAANLGNILDSCGGPYTLKLEIPTAVSANTTYGAPNTTPYGTSRGVTYTFIPSDIKICYLQPKSMRIYTGTAGSDIKYANGYNPTTWEAGKGFKKSAGFPTTGFQNAVFSVIGPGSDQSKYRCRTTSTSISLSGTASTALGANCQVTYTAATKAEFGTPTITMEYNNSTTATPNWVVIDTYTLSTPVRWAIGKGQMTYGNTNSLSTSTSFAALDACRGVASGTTTWQQAAGQNAADMSFRQQFMYRRDELTNSPYSDRGTYPENSSPTYVNNYYSRDVDGTFMGEWGYVQSYAGSGWTTSYGYWAAEAWSTAVQYIVNTRGDVSGAWPNYNGGSAVCRGE